MGEVYRARDTRLDRSVAVKVLPASLSSDPQFRERFDREARAISQLAHPNICTLYDVGEHEGTPFLVMELLAGETLEARLASGPLPTEPALAIAVNVLTALDAAHRAGIVHRDLKPGNIFLVRGANPSAQPIAKLLDFGLAKSRVAAVAAGGLSTAPTTPPASMTTAGAILGTLQYMAPEQIDGVEADSRTDLFAFGCVLFEMLTGRKAFEGKTRASLLGAILKDDPPPVSQFAPGISPGLDRLVHHSPKERRPVADSARRAPRVEVAVGSAICRIGHATVAFASRAKVAARRDRGRRHIGSSRRCHRNVGAAADGSSAPANRSIPAATARQHAVVCRWRGDRHCAGARRLGHRFYSGC
jgi:serine/threonine protein kinase